MKKVVLFSLCTAALLASCTNAGQKKDTLQVQNDSLMLELSNRDAELDEIMGAFNEIQEGFREINEAETGLTCRKALWKVSRVPRKSKKTSGLSAKS